MSGESSVPPHEAGAGAADFQGADFLGADFLGDDFLGDVFFGAVFFAAAMLAALRDVAPPAALTSLYVRPCFLAKSRSLISSPSIISRPPGPFLGWGDPLLPLV